MSLTEKIGMATIVGAGGAAILIVASAAGATLGALAGEILDNVPYIRHAIPEGMCYLANFINPDTAEKAKNAMYGNLDKVGAAVGFLSPYLKSSTKVTKND